MKTFDYETAWKELALPAYKQLPTAALVLIEETGIAAENLSQDRECRMVWPDDGGKLRELFNRLDSATLANAARVSYYYSHWRPGKSIAGAAPVVPGGWKFANYADQVLRLRFNLPDRDNKASVSLRIHEGVIRVCYSSRDMWSWAEVATANDDGLKITSEIATKLRQKIATKHTTNDRDSIAHKFIETLRESKTLGDWDTSRFMVEEAELEMRRAERMPKPDKEKLIAKIQSDFENKVAALTTERDGELWLVNHDLPKDNVIFYSHTRQWCFGWRKPFTGSAREELLARLSKFPFPYDVK